MLHEHNAEIVILPQSYKVSRNQTLLKRLCIRMPTSRRSSGYMWTSNCVMSFRHLLMRSSRKSYGKLSVHSLHKHGIDNVMSSTYDRHCKLGSTYFTHRTLWTQTLWIHRIHVKVCEHMTYNICFSGVTEIAVQENAGLENDRQKCRAGKCRTGKWRTNLQGWKMQDWKLTDNNYRG